MTIRHTAYALQILLLIGAMANSMTAQPSSAAPEASSATLSDSVRDLRDQVRQLRAEIAALRAETQGARTETQMLRQELQELRSTNASQAASVVAATAETGSQPGSVSQETQLQQGKEDRISRLDEEYQLLSGKIDDQYQTKVESASKYRVRLSGIVLLNLFANSGIVDSIDVPTLAHAESTGYAQGSFGGTLRQSQVGFEVFGPTLAGARSRADLQLDLGGGFPTVPNGVNTGLLRLRTGTMHLDWSNTSIVAGQDSLFFSPTSPTSFASLLVPALSYAGNLWGWIPQVRVEHRVSVGEESSLTLQGGILDPLSGEIPLSGNYRQPGPGEASRQPAFGSRVAWTHNVFGQPLRVGVGGFYSRQNYGFSRDVDGWAGMSDIDLPLGRGFSLSGKLYRGEALGGLYGGIGRSVLFSSDPSYPTTAVRGLNSAGGWAQLKYRATPKLEFNGAYGLDNSFAADLRAFSSAQAYGDPTLARNAGSFVNTIYRPRSDLLFSAEYRHLRTIMIKGGANTADQVNLMMGVLF